MTNQKEQNQRKQQISFVLAILGLTACFIVIIWLMLPGGNDGAPDPTPDPPQPAVAREYWTAELRLYENLVYTPYLKKVSVDDEGNVVRIERANPDETNIREDFFYKNGRLEYSETYAIASVSTYLHTTTGHSERKCYETRYVYMGDVIVKAEVYVDGIPTRSYDKYVYTIGGELDAVERYEKGKLEVKYVYNGKKYPESVECKNGVSYELEHDENGNLTRATGEGHLVEIDYENGYPTRFYYEFYDRKMSDGKSARASSSVDAMKYETTTTYVYGDNGEILEEKSEIVVTRYNNGERTHIEGYTETRTYEYDDGCRLTDVKYYLRDKFSSWRRYAYDSEGLVISSVYCDENGNEKEKNFEVIRSNLALEITHFSSGAADWTTVLQYDENGRLIREYEVDEDGAENHDKKYEYYPSGALKKKETVYGRYTETYTYTENGNLEKYTFDIFASDEDVTIEYVKSDVYYGFMRYGGMDYTFSLPSIEQTYRQTTNYEYRDDLTLEKKTVSYVKGGYDVIEYDENENEKKRTEYGADGNVMFEYDSDNGDKG